MPLLFSLPHSQVAKSECELLCHGNRNSEKIILADWPSLFLVPPFNSTFLPLRAPKMALFPEAITG